MSTTNDCSPDECAYCKCAYCTTLAPLDSDDEQAAFVAKMREDVAAQEAAREEEDRLLFGDKRAMNLEDVREAAAHVHEAAAEEDWESAHGAEDELASDFIQSLATGKLSDLQAIKQMAGEIFELLHEERTRWYA